MQFLSNNNISEAMETFKDVDTDPVDPEDVSEIVSPNESKSVQGQVKHFESASWTNTQTVAVSSSYNKDRLK